jgi:ribose transport system ATP-binding protein
VSKSFGGARALIDVDLALAPGEVHGLLGQNGSGKSTLLKVLSGFHTPDSGTLVVAGREVPLPLPAGAFRELGLAFVHQDLALVPELSVTENLMVSRLASRMPRIRWGAERRRANDVLAHYGLGSISADAPVKTLTQMERALVAIVRAVEDLRASGSDPSALVLDEPTAFLAKEGADRLFDLVRRLAEEGKGVLLVTHDLDEVRAVCDRVTVLRDGRAVATVEVEDTTTADLVRLIIGHELPETRRTAQVAEDRPVALRATGVSGRIATDVGFEVCAGEVLGISGLLGSGFEEVVHLLFGARSGTGTIQVDGKDVDLAGLTPPRAMNLGLGFVPSDRQVEASIGSLSVTDNVTMHSLGDFVSGRRLRRKQMVAGARELGARFTVAPNAPEMPLGALSGGNQQKVVLAKWMSANPKVLLLDQPTQGVDVGAREEIFEVIRDAARQGTAVICASADYDELAALCDRLLVMSGGRVVAELGSDGLDKERITAQVLTTAAVPEALEAEVVL